MSSKWDSQFLMIGSCLMTSTFEPIFFLSNASRIVCHYQKLTFKMSCNPILLYLKNFLHLKRDFDMSITTRPYCSCNFHKSMGFVIATNSIDEFLIKTMKFVIMMECRSHCGRTTFYSICISNHVHVDALMVTHKLSFVMGMSSTTTIFFQVFMIMLQSPVGKRGLSNMTHLTCVARTHQKDHRLCHNQPFDTKCEFFSPPSAT